MFGNFAIAYMLSVVYQPVRGDNPRAKARGLSPVQADKP